ncbi:MAG: hypothetical protein PHY47_20730 [Lachnospiraceae bacterium]|nr:hypothetical protein [Lachnospiraceae bacterium]
MARTNRTSEIEKQLKKKQDKLIGLKEEYDKAADEIQELLNEMKEVQKLDLMEAFDKSGRSYEEMMEFMKVAPIRTTTKQSSGRRGRPKKTI